jgi:hypothetical protein
LDRWYALLALDHSHQPPWGPLHGVAFATWTLQHPRAANRASLERAWAALHQIFEGGVAHDALFRTLREARGELPSNWSAPPLPEAIPARFDMNIAALGDFAADDYEVLLWQWSRTTYDAWNAERASP